MSVDKRISIIVARKELQDCINDAKRWKWEISSIDENTQSFIIKMRSPIDSEEYIIEIQFDNYKELPLLIEFIDPSTQEKGTKNAYPSDGSLFHNFPCICNPCSRKAYNEVYGGPHQDWKMNNWQQNPKVGSLKEIRAILRAIYFRISNKDIYKGRMK